MISAQFDKALAPLAFGTAATNATASSAVIDRQAAEFVSIDYMQSTLSASTLTTKPLALKLQEATAATGAWTDIEGFVGVTTSTAAATNFVIPASSSSTTPYRVRLNVDARGKSRYIRVVYTPNITNNNTVVIAAELSRLHEAPATGAELAINGEFGASGDQSFAL